MAKKKGTRKKAAPPTPSCFSIGVKKEAPQQRLPMTPGCRKLADWLDTLEDGKLYDAIDVSNISGWGYDTVQKYRKRHMLDEYVVYDKHKDRWKWFYANKTTIIAYKEWIDERNRHERAAGQIPPEQK